MTQMKLKLQVTDALEGQQLFPKLSLHNVLDGEREVISHRYKLIGLLTQQFLRVRVYHHGRS